MLKADTVDLLPSVSGHRSFSAGEMVFEEGQPGAEMYVLLEGDLEISIQGREIDHLRKGSIVGEMALVDDRPRSATVTSVTDSKLLPIDRERFRILVRESPDFAIRVMTIMSQRLRHLLVEEVKRQRMEEELKIGRDIQLSLLPDHCPTFPGWRFAAYYRSARQVGGDLYDFITSPEYPDHLHIVIADVTGKGVPAALYMALSRMAIRAEALHHWSPAKTLSRTNHLVMEDTQSPLFLTAFFSTLDTASGRVTFANCGHEQPLWLHAESGEIEPLEARGLLIGAFPDILPEEKEIEMAPGDYLIFFTDGATEARNEKGEFFGNEGLEETIAMKNWTGPDQLLEAIVEAVETFTGATPQSDDLTLVVVQREPNSEPNLL
jgi:serine phosphatase RsbU (regulator of sigma subunit)